MAARALIAGLTSLILLGALLSWCGSTSALETGEEIISDRAAQNDGGPRIEDEITNENLKCCERAEKKQYIFVSTLDGRINAIDASSNEGRLVWSLQTDAEPLLASSLSNIPFFNDDVEYRLIPSLDGHLYMFNDAVLQNVPFNVDALLSGSLKIGSDVLSGGKMIQTHFVDIENGKVRQTCGPSGCEQFVDDAAKSMTKKLIIKRVTQTVRAVDPRTGAERWNVTVGEHEMMLEEADDDSRCVCVDENESFTLDYFKGTSQQEPSNRWMTTDLENIYLRVVPPEGVVLAFDIRNPSVLLWEAKLDSPIVQIWTLSSNGELVERSVFDPALVPLVADYVVADDDVAKVLPAGRVTARHLEQTIYIGTYSDQQYVIRSPEERKKNDLRQYANEQDRIILYAPAGQLQQIEDHSRVPAVCGDHCPTCTPDEVNSLLSQNQYPRDMGWYFYKQGRIPPSHRLQPQRLPHQTPLLAQHPTKMPSMQQYILDKLEEMSAWKFRLLVCSLIGAIVIPTLLVARFYRRKLKELNKMAAKCTLMFTQKPNDECVLPPSPVTASTVLTPPSLSRISSEPISELAADLSGQSYGRFASDFEAMHQLGRGGFGIVMESRNKHDDQLYAVKRIAFALKHGAKERVRREVKALAQLDHPGIVRYFSAWFEEPPAEWQKKVDQEMFQKCSRVIGDELSLEPTSGIRSTRSSKFGNDLEAFPPKIEDVFGNSHPSQSEAEASTFGTWTDDQQGMSRSSRILDLNNDSIHDEIKRPVVQKPLQESVEIIFGYSTTAPVSLEQGVQRSASRNRVSSSSKPSSTKSEEDSAGHNGDGLRKSISEPVGTAYLYIQMQLCHGTLKEWLLEHNTAADRDHSILLDWFDQLVCAMQYVHDLGLVHRDLKPSNIFFAANGFLKIGDFGLATKTLPANSLLDGPSELGTNTVPDDNQTGLLSSVDTVSPSRVTTDRVGTQLYMSPEQEAGKKCTLKADIYALGLIFVELLTPVKTLMERVHIIQNARRNIFSADFELSYPQEYELIQKLLSHDPHCRPTCREIRQNDLFKHYWTVRPLLDQIDHGQSCGRTISNDSGRHSGSGLSTH